LNPSGRGFLAANHPRGVTMSTPSAVLKFSCNNRPGIVAAVADYLFHAGCDILEAQQFDDRSEEKFFMRVVFRRVANDMPIDQLAS
ncbi:ACT domain-containing protein, partial [Mycobacterium tuberculosis]|nr:ACT domain-containing protein [Mycobacterium tuberculosis]